MSAPSLPGLVKSIALPPGYLPPTDLEYDDLRARALTRADLEADVRGVNASIELIRRTRGGDWPAEAVGEDFDYVDLVWHEAEFREGYSFSYAVYDAEGTYLGCCYLYPLGRRTPLTEELLGYGVDVSWWVTPEAYRRGYYSKLYLALQHWLAHSLRLGTGYFSNLEIPAPPEQPEGSIDPADPDPGEPALRAMARQVLDGNRYLVLGTTEPDGAARVSPVYFTHGGYTDVYWVSSPLSTHSRNIARDPRVALVVFDSSVPPASTQAVYLGGPATQVPDDELAGACAVAFAGLGEGARAFTPEELSGESALRLYRARVSSAEVHVRGRDPVWGSGSDRRVRVSLT